MTTKCYFNNISWICWGKLSDLVFFTEWNFWSDSASWCSSEEFINSASCCSPEEFSNSASCCSPEQFPTAPPAVHLKSFNFVRFAASLPWRTEYKYEQH